MIITEEENKDKYAFVERIIAKQDAVFLAKNTMKPNKPKSTYKKSGYKK
jgi:hypothetical protein